METLLKKTIADHGLSGIGINIFSPVRPDITVYLHWPNGNCTSWTAATFADAVAGAVLEANEIAEAR